MPDEGSHIHIGEISGVHGGGITIAGRDVVGYSAEEVGALLEQIRSTFQPRPFTGECPYLGLQAFTEAEAEHFFGRQSEAAQLLERVRATRFLLVAGPSGSGKSSLVRAGLLHALQQGALEGSQRWLYTTLTPGREPLEALASAMARLAKDPRAGDYLRENAGAHPEALHKLVDTVLSERPEQRAVIFVDQFEELFTQAARAQQAAFIDLLVYAASAAQGRALVILAMRSDFIAYCAAYPALNDLVNRHFYQLGAMRPESLVSAIASPALRVGLVIDPGLVSQIVADMSAEPGALPLMQFALRDLFEASASGGGVPALTRAAYLGRGGVHKALENHANAAFSRLPGADQELARAVFAALVQVGSTAAQAARRTAGWEELTPAGASRAQVEHVVRELADARLVTTDEHNVTLAHERLIDAWPWLRRLVDENHERIALQNQIATDAREWQDGGRDPSYLYRGARLATASEQIAAGSLTLSEMAQAYIQAGVQAEAERRQGEERRRNALLASALLVAAVMAVLGFVAWGQWQAATQRLGLSNQRGTQIATGAIALGTALDQAEQRGTQAAGQAATAQAERERAEAQQATAEWNAAEANRQERIAASRQLANQALVQLDNQLDLSLLLASEAYRAGQQVGYVGDARNALLTTLQHNPYLVAYLSRTAVGAGFAPDGGVLAADGEGIRLFQDLPDPLSSTRLALPALLHPWDADFDLRDGWELSFDPYYPGGSLLVSASMGGDLVVWDLSKPQGARRLATLPRTENNAGFVSAAFGPDGRLLAVKGCPTWGMFMPQQGEIELWDLSDPLAPRLAGGPIAIDDCVWRMALSGDGRLLAASAYHSDEIILWDVSNPDAPVQLARWSSVEVSYPYFSDRASSIQSLAFQPGQPILAAGRCRSRGAAGCIQGDILFWSLFDPAAPQQIGTPLAAHKGAVTQLAYSSNGWALASAGGDGSVLLWDVSDPNTPVQVAAPFYGHTSRGLSFSPNGERLVSTDLQGRAVLWQVETPRPLLQIGPAYLAAATNEEWLDLNTWVLPAVHPSGKLLYSGDQDGKLRAWDASNLPNLTPLGQPIQAHSEAVTFLEVSPDGKQLASGSETEGKLALWDLAASQSPQRLAEVAAFSGAFSPDWKLLATGGGQVRLWDLSDPRQPAVLGSDFNAMPDLPIPLVGFVDYLAFHPAGRLLVAGNGNAFALWDLSNPRSPRQVSQTIISDEGISYRTTAALSPDGLTLVIASTSYFTVWDLSSPAQPVRLTTIGDYETYNVCEVVFSPDGKTLLQTIDDRLVVWDLSEPAAPVQLGAPVDLSYSNDFTGLAFGPGGLWAVSGVRGARFMFWDLDAQSWLVRACRSANRDLSAAEWRRYLGSEPYSPVCTALAGQP